MGMVNESANSILSRVRMAMRRNHGLGSIERTGIGGMLLRTICIIAVA
jgi:hypothetical protein